MRRLAAGPATEAARRVEAAELGGPVPESPELDWARLRAFEAALPRLMEAALRRLLDDELALRPEHIRAVVQDLLARAELDHGPFVLRIHPEDRPLLEPLPLSLRLQEDPTLRRGGCVLSSPDVELDASMETRLARVLRALSGD